MSPAPVEPPLPKALSAAGDSCAGPRFSNLRGVRWRINLGILPCSSSASIEDLRRVAADSRRRYASLRRRLLIDPHLPKDGNRSPDLANDNPLSQNPDSIWGRFFRNAELEKMVDQDLSRLYPDHGSYFQTPACQAMLRRILLLWCLRHPEYGYRQGMHELLAPLLYVLHVDLQHLSEVQGLYEDYFNDEFDETSFLERVPVSDPRFTKPTDKDAGEKDSRFDGSTAKAGSLDELDPDTRDIFMLSDPYGAEGELGVVLSERFMEHDAYCMFDSLMNGARGVVAMADFFSPSPPIGSSTGVPPVIEASSALYHLLSIVDSSLHGHLVELGVEPQYFALRWLRVLFGREFSLDDLLAIWDELFSSPNNTCAEDDAEYSFRILCSPRGAFIAAMAVSMLLHVRSSLFATENATSCLKRLLNFPKNTNVKKLIEKAKSLQALALETNTSSSPLGSSGNKNKSLQALRVYNCSFDSASSKTPLHTVPDSYWEEKWRKLHKEEALKNGSRSEKSSRGILKGSLVERLRLSRAESDPSPAKSGSGEKNPRSSVRRRLLDDLSREVGSDADLGKTDCDEIVPDLSCSEEPPSVEGDGGKQFPEELDDQNITGRTSNCMAEAAEETCLSGDNSSAFSTTASPHSMGNDEDNASEKSSVTSNSFIADNDEETTQVEERCSDKSENSSVHESEVAAAIKPQPGTDGPAKREAGLKERKPLAGKFQWFWRLGRGSGEGNSERGGSSDTQRSTIAGNICKHIGGSSSECNSCRDSCRLEVGDKKVMGTLKSLGNSMVENIQVIESAFKQDRDRAGNIETVMAALEELRKISNMLSGM